MIHIADTKVARRYGDYFLRQINKLQDVSCFNLCYVGGSSLHTVVSRLDDQMISMAFHSLDF